MKSISLLLLLCLFGGLPARADEPLYVVRLKSTKSFELVPGNNSLSFYPFSPMMAKANDRFVKRKILGADYLTGIRLRTKEPKIAVQDLMREISEQTGLDLGITLNGSLAEIAPITVLQGVSETAVINLLLTPKENDIFILTCTYTLDARPEGSTDGTPAGMTKTEAVGAQMTADSIATVLPEKFTKAELKSGDYFFPGLVSCWISDPLGGNPMPVMALHLKTGEHYTLGIYQEVAGVCIMIDQPINLSGHGPARVYGRNKITSLRSRKKEGGGGFDFFVENGHVVRKSYTE